MSLSFPSPTDPCVPLGTVICPRSALAPGRKAFRFQVQSADVPPFTGNSADPDEYLPAFLIQFEQGYYAYLNRCAHLPMELDWNPGEVFSEDGQTIVCSTHYAVYAPRTGDCLRGPCPKGSRLIPLPITVLHEAIFFGNL